MKPSTESVSDFSSEFEKIYTTKDLAIELVTRRCSNLFNAYVKEIETSSDRHVAELMFAFEGSYEEITSMELNVLEKYKGERIRRRNSEHLTELTKTPVSGVRIWNCDGHVIYVPECFKIVIDDAKIKKKKNNEKTGQPGKQDESMSGSTKSKIFHDSQLQTIYEKQVEEHEEHTSCFVEIMEEKEQEFQSKCDEFVEQLSGYLENLCNKLDFNGSNKVVEKAVIQSTENDPIVDKRYVNYNQVVSPDTSTISNQNAELQFVKLCNPQFLIKQKSGNNTSADHYFSSELEQIEETGVSIEGSVDDGF
ncbi:hypothetical protein GCK72_023564 [Caenorhabditis remanei]|uniref:Uncharacterized protein n=1 Tax=Caenorhabditis remanei TaxID=31234 RepID=A0A6A5FX69_CAERE|nr:hypothetical protein GCK72_023564 [Caenorhabditis remanei]KAF1747105.1 hypothetical protein GCK72_023564 [Caenorhabditis remanei]